MTIRTIRSLGIDIVEFSVISEKFQKFQINNRITIKTIRSLDIDIVEFLVISEKFQKL